MTRLIKRLSLLVLVLFMATAVVACGGGEEAADPEVDPNTLSSDSDGDAGETENEEPTPEPEPTDEPTQEPTEEPTPEPTEEPTATPDPAAGFAQFTSPEGGFSVKYPEGWVAQDLFGFVVLVSDEALLEADDFGGDGAAVLIVSGTEEEMELDLSDLDSAMDESIEQMDIEGEIVEGPDRITINGMDAVRVVITDEPEDGGSPLTAVAYLVPSDGRVVFMAGITDPQFAEDNRPIFEAMAQTLELMEPTVSIDDDLVDLGTDFGGPTELLFFGDVATGTIGAEGSTVWEVIAIEGELLDIVVTPNSDELDVIVDVVDIDGNSILGGAVDNSFGVEELLEIEITETGTYFINVTGFDNGDVGDYQITFNESGVTTTTENVGGVETTPQTAGDLAYGATIEGAITSDNQSPGYTFAGSEGDIVSLIVNPDDGLDVTIDVLDPSGESLIFAGFDNSTGQEITMFELESVGEHTVVVEPFDEGSTGSFELILGGPDGSLIFADDAIEEDTEEHFFPFNALEGEIVNIIVMPQGDFDVVVTLFNDDTEEELISIDRSFGSEGLGYIIPEDGNYYYAITGFVADDENSEGGESLGDYDVMLFGTHLVISETTTGDTVRGVFSTQDGIIEFFISLDPEETITLTLDVSEDVDGVIEVRDLDGNSLASADENVSGGAETLTYTASEEGIVIIRISEFFGGSGAYVLTVE